jgi:hypothetical protein
VTAQHSSLLSLPGNVALCYYVAVHVTTERGGCQVDGTVCITGAACVGLLYVSVKSSSLVINITTLTAWCEDVEDSDLLGYDAVTCGEWFQ